MCDERRCNPIRHWLGLCDHYRQVNEIQTKIVHTRAMTNKELKQFNRTLNLVIKDENIKVTLTNIKKVSEA
jgi:hypothetical protein